MADRVRQGEEGHRETAPVPGAGDLLRLLAGAERKRLSSCRLGDRTIWIKRFDTESRAIATALHGLFSPLLPFAVLRASPAVGAHALAEREARKAARFREEGFPVPDIIHRGDAVLVLSSVSKIVEPMLDGMSATDPAGHDELLVEMAAALGRAHACGLCHGRPHPRDMFRTSDGLWGFLDFEEEPEKSMKLASAQARDIWLLFMQIVGRARQEETAESAFAAWRAEAPAAILPELRKLVAFFSVFVPVMRLLKPFGLGKDGRRFLDGTVFLRAALGAQKSGSPLPGTARKKSKQYRIGTPT